MKRLLPPLVLVMALLALCVQQVTADLKREPAYESLGGLPIMSGSGQEAGDDAPICMPLGPRFARELPELHGMRLAGTSSCEAGWDGPVVLESWAGGRFVWQPGRALRLERRW